MTLSSDPSPAPEGVYRRRVFYIPGYDPFPPRRYRELYRAQGRLQAQISGYEIAQSARTDAGRFGWNVTLRREDKVSSATIEVLVWSDIVQNSMGRSIPATYGQLLRTAWIYIGSGALFRLSKLRAGPILAALYPVAFLIVQMVCAFFISQAAVWAVRQIGLPDLMLLKLGLGLLVFWGVLEIFRRLDSRFFAYYLMHDFAHTAKNRGAYPKDLEVRLSEFCADVRSSLSEPMDEVLIVGHSSGAHLGISVLADLERSGALVGAAPAVSLLTLGQVVPMVSFLPDAHRLRRDLQVLSQSQAITWVDVTAPGDGCAFALCDPVAVSGVGLAEQKWPLVISAAFSKTLSPEKWKSLKRRFFRIHFQYLSAFDRPGIFDYFQITAGNQTLGARFAGKKPSPSRLTKPVNGHCDL